LPRYHIQEGFIMKKLRAVSLASLLVSGLALADTVDNPGDFNLAFDDGVLKIGILDPASQISQLTIAGTVDGDGNVTIPADRFVVPDFQVDSPVGPVTVRFVPSDATGTLVPLTGEATVMVSMRIRLIHTLLPATCGIGPIDFNLTADSSGDFMGVPYSMDDGTATYVDGLFTVPGSDSCGGLEGTIDGLIGLPCPGVCDTNNYVDGLHGQFDPIFVGS
jgi:hypothetical protein